ncbi:phosphoglycerate mutase-like protein [Cylindrobasidium torrendii FP15055 ss-10]|uniref:Phosphoglycerate mutase-like protein n=1 Tax=Cylindrobasidium torrendii FP15055 ss-10 TaxID=1314674 RepID=A0A0D7BQH7_9AGAR|nr:phosphoglycerate mutase-like protein [Cylindrobasidium torrendii FP15055 ss-10]
MVEKIYLLRHGFRLNWVTADWTSATGLPRDPPLAATGVKQSEEVADFFLSLPESERPTAIFSSPYYRCIQTSMPVAKALGIPIWIEHGLGEWYSPAKPGSGLHPRPGPASTLTKFFPPNTIDPDGWTPIHYPTRKGETVDDIINRVKIFLEDLTAVRPANEKILLCSHAATIAAAVRILKGDLDLPVRIGTCSISEFDLDPSTKKWTPLKISDASHLSEGLQREWGFQDIEIDKGQVVADAGEGGPDEEEGPVGSQVRGKEGFIPSNL